VSLPRVYFFFSPIVAHLSYQFDYLIIIGMSLMDDWRAATQTDPKGDRILGGNQTPPPPHHHQRKQADFVPSVI
jgi:hypothetical protein